MRTIEDLRMMQALPLKAKVLMTQQRIREWVREYGTDGIYISFSGGKDSTVLLHLVRGLYPDIEAVFVNTGLEYPEIQKFVMTFDNVTILRPKMRFDEVIKKFGYHRARLYVARRKAVRAVAGISRIRSIAERGADEIIFIRRTYGEAGKIRT